MVVKVLSQGLSEGIDNSVGAALIENLCSTRYFSFTGISAFASEAGINGLSHYIEVAKETFVHGINIIVGVDQKATSKEALESLVSLGVNAYIFYHTGYTIFHPKVYLFEGEEIALLIVGSSNLTTQGLFTNVEASLQLELSMDEEKDRQLLENIKAQFATLFNFSDPNLKPITNELITQLCESRVKKDVNAQSGSNFTKNM
jgi:HKD family nuclease